MIPLKKENVECVQGVTYKSVSRFCAFSLSLHDTSVLKGIAICAMLCHHLFYQSPEFGYVVWHLAMLGKVCVAIFLLLSGYGLTIQMKKLITNSGGEIRGGQICHFLLKRYTKFYFNYWVIFLIFVPIGVFCFDRPLTIPYGETANVLFALLKDFMGLQSFHSYNITWWFNQLIIVLWLVFPILYWMVNNKCLRWIVLPVSMSFFRTNELAFVLGIYIAMYQGMIDVILRKIPKRVFMVLLSFIFVGLCVNREHAIVGRMSGIYADPYIALVLSCMVAIITKRMRYQIPLMAYLGKHSMNMYMVHTFVFSYFFHDFIYSFQYPIFIFSALLLSSLGVSIVLETLKTKLKFYVLVGSVTNKLSA